MKTIQIAISILLMVLLTSPRVNAALSRADLNSDADSVFPLGSSTTEEQASSRKSLRSNRRLKLYDGWNMLWQDEFDFWDANKWAYQFGDGCQINLCGWGNGEMEYYTSSPNNVRVDNGNLIIEAKEETGVELAAVQQQCWDDCGQRCEASGLLHGSPELHSCVVSCGQNRCPNIKFTSARINTDGKFSISPSPQYSTIRIEARIQLTPGAGLWPAFWLLPQDQKYGIWPVSGELDIMETHTSMTGVNGTIHFGGEGERHRYITKSAKLTPGFHTYRVDWSEKEIRWYVDDKPYGVVTNREPRQGWFSASQKRMAASNAPFGAGDNFYLLLNMAVGGAYPGYPSPASVSKSLAGGPKQMVVDYVRVLGR